ncbi:replication initiation protein [Lamprobacter modestohalophilus]|uniref:replication initiation protein n=1 Tax=Lamprobacter modestohalophilus TaxID=1064514 RepID=UPI002ADEAC09|nr:replication initiation protein [Lamprobacter modestohalophilus]MEA1052482.1 replication initiation protein [Lamprobacter modestohalophilus]
MEELQVYKSNALIEASYRLSLSEQRIILACIAQIRRDEAITDEYMYTVTAKDFANLSDVPEKNSYRDLSEAALRLSRREVYLRERPNSHGRHETVLMTRWVQSVRYEKNSGNVQLRFSKDMLPYLSQLTEQFTRYALGDVAKMNSAHAIRLYEILVQWRHKGVREISVHWLRTLLQIEDKYPVVSDLKRRVIEPAVKEINRESPLDVTWKQLKTGRQITGFIFFFRHRLDAISVDAKVSSLNHPAAKKSLPQRTKEKPRGRSLYGIPMSVIEAKAHTGESYEEAAARLLREAHAVRNQAAETE